MIQQIVNAAFKTLPVPLEAKAIDLEPKAKAIEIWPREPSLFSVVCVLGCVQSELGEFRENNGDQ